MMNTKLIKSISKKVAVGFGVIAGLVVLGGTASADLINNSNTEATPYEFKDATIYHSKVTAENIVSKESQLPQSLSEPSNFKRNERAPFVFYSSNSSLDKSERVNPAKLTANQTVELARYGVKLINEYRESKGLSKLKLTAGMQTVEAQYVKYRLSNAIDKHGIGTYNTMYNRFFKPAKWTVAENLSYDYDVFRMNESKATTMLALKVTIYNGISQMMFCDGGANKWGHRINFMDKRMKEIGMGLQNRPGSPDDKNFTVVWNLGTYNDKTKNLTTSGTMVSVAGVRKSSSKLSAARTKYIKKIKALKKLSASNKRKFIARVKRAKDTKKMANIYKQAFKIAKRSK